MKQLFILLIALLCLTVGRWASASTSEQWSNRVNAHDAQQNPYGLFGYSIDLSGDYAVMGSPGAGPGFSREGAAYVFKSDSLGSWNEIAKLTAQPPAGGDALDGDQFGFSVGISGTTVVVGANSSSANGNDSGLGYVFEEQGGVWTQMATLSPVKATANQLFGSSAKIDEGVAMIGAASWGSGSTSAGRVYVFDDSLGNWQQRQELTPTDGADNDRFGFSVDLDGTRAIIGSYLNDSPAQDAGSAYIFQADAFGSWSQTAKLVAHDADFGDEAGLSVAISGAFAIVGARGDDAKGNDAGAAYIYQEVSAGAWSQVAKLTASDASASQEFGYSVAIDGDRALVSAIADDQLGNQAGAAYLFTRIGSIWTEAAKITAIDGRQDDLFGSVVAIEGNRSMISARNWGGVAGAAYFNSIPEPCSAYLVAIGLLGGVIAGRRLAASMRQLESHKRSDGGSEGLNVA